MCGPIKADTLPCLPRNWVLTQQAATANKPSELQLVIASTILMVDMNTPGEIGGVLWSEARETNPLVMQHMNEFTIHNPSSPVRSLQRTLPHIPQPPPILVMAPSTNRWPHPSYLTKLCVPPSHTRNLILLSHAYVTALTTNSWHTTPHSTSDPSSQVSKGDTIVSLVQFKKRLGKKSKAKREGRRRPGVVCCPFVTGSNFTPTQPPTKHQTIIMPFFYSKPIGGRNFGTSVHADRHGVHRGPWRMRIGRFNCFR
ncbi:hypothetical protein CSPX01_14091 [Colletotrichum filicis]|nr:hypothetical protein CSPX01_14091 [Colletotrichum filicis]